MKMALLAAIGIGFIEALFVLYAYNIGIIKGKEQVKKEWEEWLKPGVTFRSPPQIYKDDEGNIGVGTPGLREKKETEETTI